jgi:hypothetical protein
VALGFRRRRRSRAGDLAPRAGRDPGRRAQGQGGARRRRAHGTPRPAGSGHRARLGRGDALGAFVVESSVASGLRVGPRASCWRSGAR